MKFHLAKILTWNGIAFELIDFKQAETQESLGSIIREYVGGLGLRLVYWSRV